MNERLLNLYWYLILALLFGDGLVGVAWIFRYNYVVANLRTDLKARLNNAYGFDPQFQVCVLYLVTR